MNSLLLFINSFFVSLALVPLCRAIAFKVKIIDHPGERKIHKDPIPYLGGLAIFLGFIAGLLIVFLQMPGFFNREILTTVASSTIILALGIYDDARGMNARKKFAVQFIVATVIVANDIYLKEIKNPFGDGQITLGYWGRIISVLWIVAITNAINLLDGLDGLAAGVTTISLMFMAAFAWYSGNIGLMGMILALAGGITGFLVFNFPPAKIFMGDAGSLLIGFLMAVFCLMIDVRGPASITILLPALLLTIPIFDTLSAIFRRVRNRQNIFSADKKHLHHRLLEVSQSFRKTLLVIYLANAFIGGIATLTLFLPPDYRLFLIIILANNLFFAMYTLHLFESRQYWKSKAGE